LKEYDITRFINKTVIVTGAASGMGAAAAKRFSDEGANVVAVDLDREKVEEATRGLPADRTIWQVCDTSNKEDAVAAVRAATDRFGGLDVLINNAGIATRGDVTETTEEDWDRTMAVNVTGYFNMAKAAIPELKKTRGCIVQTSSVSGLGGDWGMVAYNTSKGAVTNMTRAMALDHAEDGVRVNEVNPTVTRTAMSAGISQDEATIARILDRIPMKRLGQADDIAKVMVFLASDDAGFVTGVNLPVDGGLAASTGQPEF
jgi:meso-butanediol dehydrogenase / (S,S)-butanediol dehydrogenase / diacetyl reductase